MKELRKSTTPLGLVCIIIKVLAILMAQYSSKAQNAPEDFLNAHNIARAAVGVGPLVWDEVVAAYARNYANEMIGSCGLVHSNGPYGENIAVGTGEFTGTAAVQLWVSEKTDYDYNSNSCAEGSVCGHYTQVVWSSSVRLGCARVQCNDSSISLGLRGRWFITCNYDPPSNFIGERPYLKPPTSYYLTCYF